MRVKKGEVRAQKALSRYEKDVGLKQVDFFKPLRHRDRLKLLSICKHGVLTRGKVLIEQGRTPENFWVLLSGEVDIYSFKEGQETPFHTTRQSGVCLGEGVILGAAQRNAKVIAKTDIELLEFTGLDVRLLTEEDEEFGSRFYFAIATVLYFRK